MVFSCATSNPRDFGGTWFQNGWGVSLDKDWPEPVLTLIAPQGCARRAGVPFPKGAPPLGHAGDERMGGICDEPHMHAGHPHQ